MARNRKEDRDAQDRKAQADELARVERICEEGAARADVQASPVARAALADLQASVATLKENMALRDAAEKALAETEAALLEQTAKVERDLRLDDPLTDVLADDEQAALLRKARALRAEALWGVCHDDDESPLN